jgi:CubicO group peptidase (beta-lactamase class C family)
VSQPAIPAVVEAGGYVADGLDEVADAFASTVARQGRGGAALAVYLDGEPVVDLTGGNVDPESLVQVFSVSKAVVAIAAAHASAAGLLDLDRPLGADWSPFSRPATASITPRMVLAHTSGIPAITRPLSLDDLLSGGLDDALAEQDPLWEPGTRLAYGAFTFGALMSGVFHHAVGTPLSDYVAEHLTSPLIAEFSFGATAEGLGRVAPLSFVPPVLTPSEALAHADGSALLDGSLVPIAADAAGFFTDPRVIRADWPAMSGVASVSGLARLFGATVSDVDGVRLLTEHSVAALTVEHSRGYDPGLYHVARFGLGVELPHARFPLLGPGSFGHQGAGGSAIAVDPTRRLAIAFLTTAVPAVLGASEGALNLFQTVRFAVDTLQERESA